MKPDHLDWLIEDKVITTSEGKSVKSLELVIADEDAILDSWAKHLREHYCAESEIDVLRAGYGLEKEEYLAQIKFPSATQKPGPSTRSGDFTEILIADYVQYVLEYFVPRTRYDRKVNRNSSTMGSDLIGCKCGDKVSQNDELIVFEVKAAASQAMPKTIRLQDAINDSSKDILRLAESLNAVHQRLIDRQDFDGAQRVQRFQNATDNPYKKVYAAAAVHSEATYSESLIKAVSTFGHNDPDLLLLVVRCDNLMKFIHEMYGRACRC